MKPNEEVIDFLVELLKRETVTPNECGVYELVKNVLNDFEIIEHENNGVKNIFLYKDFSLDSNESKKPHLCFAGHIDVVPSGDGWSYPPFGGVIEDSFLYGRGAQDMKGGVASLVYALKELKEFSGIVSVLLTSDEEGIAIDGTNAMLEILKNRDFLPHYCVLAECTSCDTLGDVMKIGRRGSISGVLKIEGIQGHAAYPHKCDNPVDKIVNILPKLSNVKLDEGNEEFSESRIIITDIRAGMEVVNVTPKNVKIMFNVRNNPNINQDSIKEYIAKIFEGVPYTLELSQNAYPFITKSEILTSNLSKAVFDVRGITPEQNTHGGTSDARFISAFGVEVVELGLKNDRIHGIDERVPLKDVIDLKKIFSTFIKYFDTQLKQIGK